MRVPVMVRMVMSVLFAAVMLPVGGIAFRDADHHALAGTRQQDSVSVDLIGFSLFRADVQPAVAGKREVLPHTVIPTQVAIPNEAGPVQLQPLHIELRGSIFKELRGSDIRNIIQKPVHRIRLAADIDRERAQALRLRRNDQAVAFRAPRLSAQPVLCGIEVTRQHDGVFPL